MPNAAMKDRAEPPLWRRVVADLRLMFVRPPRLQFAALCYRFDPHGEPEILLITSRETARWVLPKGWPMSGRSEAEAAAQEAFEEAGVLGSVCRIAIGQYHYGKRKEGGLVSPCLVKVFALEVETLLDDYPESHERKRAWFRANDAAARVDEPELATLLTTFQPPPRRRRPADRKPA